MPGEAGRGEGFVRFRYGMVRCGKDEQRHRYVLHGIGKATNCIGVVALCKGPARYGLAKLWLCSGYARSGIAIEL